MTTRNTLLATSLVGAFVGLGGTALAQNAPPPAPSGASVSEVVVTAQRRSERLVDVPISIAVVTGAQIAERGITNITGLEKLTGGVQMSYYGSYLEPSIRGVTAQSTDPAVTSGISIYLDGVYQTSQEGSVLSLPDVQDIEILKGPQGTLYGQNALGGAIVVTTLEPQFKWQGQASVSYGNYNDIWVKGFETGPITDSIAQSLAVNYQNHQGFLTSPYDGKPNDNTEDEVFRGKLLFKPNDKAAITVTAYYTWRASTDFDGIPYDGESVAAGYNRAGQPIVPGSGPSVISGVDWHNFTDAPSRLLLTRTWGADIKGVFDVGLGKLTWLTAYEDTTSDQLAGIDLDDSPLNIADDRFIEEDHDMVTQGDFVSKPIGPVEFSTGLFYAHLNDQNDPTIFNLFGFGPSYTVQPNTPPNYYSPSPYFNTYNIPQATRDTLAGYLEGTFHVTPAFTITAGGRYTTDTMHAYSNVSPTTTDLAETEFTHSPASWNNFSPRVTARYALNHQNDVYFSYSQGFRAGLLNVAGTGIVTSALPVKPETLDAYEVGYKGRLFDTLSLGLAGFYYQYQNKQESAFAASGGTSGFVVFNAASAEMDGVDLDLTWVATPQLTFTGAAEWLEAHFVHYPGATVDYWDASTASFTSPAAGVNLSGRQMERAPKWTGAVSGDYHIDTDMGRFNANAAVYYSSSECMEETCLVIQKSYATLDMEVGYAPASQPNLRFVLWGKNLTDQGVISSAIVTTYSANVTYEPPRQFGGRIEYKF